MIDLLEEGAPGPVLVAERKGSVCVLTMNARPHNLIGVSLMQALPEAIAAAVADGSRAIILRSGLRNFSAGADISLFETPPKTGAEKATPAKVPRITAVEFLRAFETAPIPIIASVHGVCLGGGMEIALACDLIVAAASAKFGAVEVTLGLHPIMGGVQRQVQRVGIHRAKELSMLGRRYDAATLERWGLINLVVADETLETATLTLAEELANGPTVAHAATKQLAYVAANEGVVAADNAMDAIQKPIWASQDLQTGLKSFMRAGPGLAVFEGK